MNFLNGGEQGGEAVRCSAWLGGAALARRQMSQRKCPLCRSVVKVSTSIETHRDGTRWRYFLADCLKCKWSGGFIDYKERVKRPNE